MRRVLAICGLTWRAAFRLRLFWVIVVLLFVCVAGLPLLITDDGTAQGFTQIILTYTLTVISALLGLTTLWTACGTLARDIEECQIQVVAVKPVSRWQIWFGKWLGLVTMNALLLALSGACVYGLMQWRAKRLPVEQQLELRNEVLVARGSAREISVDKDIVQETDRRLAERLKENPISTADLPEVKRNILEQVRAEYQVVPPGFMRQWKVTLPEPERLRGKPLQLRIKFNASDGSTLGTFVGLWQVGVPAKTQLWRSEPMSLAPEAFHEFEIPADLYEPDGTLTVTFVNSNQIALLFPLEDGFEALYPVGGFAGNFVRGLVVLFCWMVLLATIGLSASTFLSFPVAAFVSLAMLTVVFSSGTMENVVSDGTITGWNAEKGTRGFTPLDYVVIPTFKAVLQVINLAKNFSPIDYLGTGRIITWAQLGQAVLQIVVLLGGVVAVFGIWVFNRRELATAQGNQ